jgi:DNA-binding NarL/FixJ family response regulator
VEILIIDERPLLRAGVARFARGFDVREAATPAGLAGVTPRVVLLGLRPDSDTKRLLAAARRFGAPVVCLLDSVDAGFVRAALAVGADGYLLFDELDAELLRVTVEAVQRGERAISPGLESRHGADGAALVTHRCWEVVQSLADGLRDGEIAERLGISTSSVRKHIANAQDRLQARTRTQVVAIAADHGLL